MERGYVEERGYADQLRTQDEVANYDKSVRQAPESRMTAADPEAVARDRRIRRREIANAEALRARSGLWTMTVMANWAIRQAARVEPNRAVRRERRNILADTWRRFTGDLMRQAGRL